MEEPSGVFLFVLGDFLGEVVFWFVLGPHTAVFYLLLIVCSKITPGEHRGTI